MYTDQRRIQSACFLSALTLLVASIAGCGNEAVNLPDAAPYVLSTVPALGAAGVALNSPVGATFDKPVNCSTVTASSFTVASSGPVAVAGTVTCSGSTATFTPSAPLALHTLYTAVITTGVTDVSGLAMVQPYSWNFEAIVAPSVVSTTPATGAAGLPFNQTFSATFLVLPTQDPDSAGGALNCSTLTSSTFTVTAAAVPVAGAVTCSGATATFTPTAPLASGTTYTATLTTGVQNAAGTALPTAYVWTSTTDTPPVVTATLPANGATGVLLTQAISAAFSKQMNCATLYSPAKTFTVTGPGTTPVVGTVSCTGNGATFLPSSLLATNTLYTATIAIGATDLQGISVASNYVWSFITVPTPIAPTSPAVISTAPANLAAGVPINQAVSATFSEAMNPATISASTFTLTAPGNVAVAGAVAYAAAGSVATFTPTAGLTANTTYVATVKTGAQDLSGNALAANYVWTFTTGAAPNTTKPTVISTVPSPSGVTGVPTNQAVSATFSEAMNPLTLSAATFTLTGPGTTPVTGLVTYAGVGNTVTFTPTVNLTASTLFTATVTTGAQDLSGNALASNYVFTFTTGAGTGTTQPTIVSTSPANGANSVPINQAVSATFSKAMNPLTINTTTFTVTGPGGTTIAGTIAYNAVNFIATFTPTVSLAANTTYTADVTSGATDLASNPLGSGGLPNPWSFTTYGSAGPPPVALGTAALFGDLGGTAGMTNSGSSTVINGDIGTTGVSTLVVDFHDETVITNGVAECSYSETPIDTGGQVNGTIYTAPGTSIPTAACPNEGTAVTSAIAAQAALDARSAYNQLVAFPNGIDVSTLGGSASDLGNRTLAPGIYKSAPGSYAISAGPLTLDAQGNPNAFWVFQAATTLTVGTPSANESVILVNGAQAANVFWQVGSFATINGILGGGTMQGTIISQTGASVSTAGVAAITTINGRVLSLGGSVTVVNTVINTPAP
jgi:hypothetical protein